MLKVVSVFGTRPEAAKMAPLIKALERDGRVESVVCATAQHREMLDQVLDIFGITPAHDLNIMRENQSLADITTRALNGLQEIFMERRPDLVLVHGDTTTTLAASLAAYYARIPVGHVEAGLRTYDKYQPFPEEMNRRLTSAIAELHFAPTHTARDNLLRENVPAGGVFVTGNTAIDCMKTTVSENYIFRNGALNRVDFAGRRVILMTAHRRENLGRPIEEICAAARTVAERYEDVEIVYPVHRNPAVRDTARAAFDGAKRALLLDPVDLEDMHNLIKRCYLVLTDSGGLQEEAPALDKPVVVLRNVTERPEGLAAGTLCLAGTRKDDIIKAVSGLLDDKAAYEKMAGARNPFGDGNASERIVQAILYHFGMAERRPAEFSL